MLLDASAQHAGRTGREILTIAQQIMGLPGRRVDEMLDTVSLTGPEADRRVRNYSLGMRQRLGIATALIGDPEVLILDEPANGLDPAGIRWMRDLLRDYADHGGTVLLSSHLLHEIEIIADDIVMIGHGRIVSPGLEDRAASRRPGPSSAPRDIPALQRALAAAGVSTTVSDDGPCAPTRTPARSDESALRRRRGRSPSSATPTVADSRRCSSSSPPTPSEKEQRHDRHHHRPDRAPVDVNEFAPIPLEPGRPRRAAQDVRHPVGVLADREHRHHRSDRHDRDHRVRAGRRPDLLQLRQGGRVPDHGDPADGRPAVHHQRVEPAQRADDVHLRPEPGAGGLGQDPVGRHRRPSPRCCSRS